ncbi:MAG TPA: glutamate--tRNA ligase family protein [Acetobacteraceae bacterium]|nr:glutamate--tRNA ligase family protein [Acetobacteraceae bacterium]
MSPVVRFACGPARLLTVSDARTALANYLFAVRHGGRLILRIDDADADRAKPDLAENAEQDLRWLGVAWEQSVRQSARLDRYATAAERLKRAGRLYPCFESEPELQASRERRLKRGLTPAYDRAMLKLTPTQRATAEASGKRPYWRFLLSGQTIAWTDLVLGHRRIELRTVSDPVLIRADGLPVQNFRSAVDDLETGITHVIRRQDRLAGTGVQLDLLAAFGADPAGIAYAHLPTSAGADAGRLDKRPLRSLRREGVEPAALANFLLRSAEPHEATIASLDELAAGLDLATIPPIAWDATQLLALNRGALRHLPFTAVAARLPAGATEMFWLAVRDAIDLLSEARGWWDVVAGTIVPPVIEGERELLRIALDLLPAEPWDERVWSVWTRALRETTGRHGQALSLPLRLALTGEEQGPELRHLLPLMGRARAANRLHIAA